MSKRAPLSITVMALFALAVTLATGYGYDPVKPSNCVSRIHTSARNATCQVRNLAVGS